MFQNSCFAEQSWSDQQNAARSSLRSEFFSSERFMYPWTNPPAKIRYNLILAENMDLKNISHLSPKTDRPQKTHCSGSFMLYSHKVET